MTDPNKGLPTREECVKLLPRERLEEIRERVRRSPSIPYTPDNPFPNWQHSAQCEKDRGDLASHAAALEELLGRCGPYLVHADHCGDADSYNNAHIETCGCGLSALLKDLE